METGLGGPTVVVTGATANIGRGIALAFAAEGAKLVVVGRAEAQGCRVCGQLLERGAEDALWQQCDVTDRPQVDAMADAVRELDFALNFLFARLMSTRAQELRSIGRRTLLERQFAVPAEIGAAAVYLASEAAGFVTGQVLPVDGGTLIA